MRLAGQVIARRVTRAFGLALLAMLLSGAVPALCVDLLTAASVPDLMRIGPVTLVDIRTAAERSAHGVPRGSAWIEWRGDAHAASFLAALERLQPDRSAALVLICSVGHQSGRVARRVEQAGYRRVYDVGDGMNGSVLGPGWKAWGLPLADVK